MADEALATLINSVKSSGHTLVRRFRGKFFGLACERCQQFRRNAEFNKWKKKCVPKPIPRQIVQDQESRRAAIQKERMRKLVAKAKEECESPPHKNARTGVWVAKPPTAEDEDEIANLNVVGRFGEGTAVQPKKVPKNEGEEYFEAKRTNGLGAELDSKGADLSCAASAEVNPLPIHVHLARALICLAQRPQRSTRCKF